MTDALTNLPVATSDLDIGVGFIRAREYDEAIAAFDRFLMSNPSHAQGLFLRGVAWHRKGDFLRAIDDYDRALLSNPSNLKARQRRDEAVGQLGLSKGRSPDWPTSSPHLSSNGIRLSENTVKVAGIGLFVAFSAYWLVSCSQGFSSLDIKTIEKSIWTEFSKRDGVQVRDVKMIKETNTKLTGYVRLWIPGIDIEITKSCNAIYGQDAQTMWQCQ
jgi:tetratricopeptide (TPR) repeat protein